MHSMSDGPECLTGPNTICAGLPLERDIEKGSKSKREHLSKTIDELYR